MLRLRPFKKCDAAKVAYWLRKEEIYNKWGGSHIGAFPLSEEQIAETYLEKNGLCSEEDNFYPVTAVEGNEVVGCFIMRYVQGDPQIIRFGWVIVDEEIRGKGIGKRMLTLGLKYAFEILGAKKITIGVFENNTPAYRCYRSIGFVENGGFDIVDVGDEKWKCIELEIASSDAASTGAASENEGPQRTGCCGM